MAIDIRAKVYCSLGPVISGNISDDYLQGVGLIKTKGQVILNGSYTLAAGTITEFAYLRDGVLSRIPRTLRVLSSFIDPYRDTTTVELGCKFTYLENRKPVESQPGSTEGDPPIGSDPTSAEENAEVPCEVFRKAIIPISAKYVFQQALLPLGVTSSFEGLTNKFSVEKFDLSGGYFEAISDLLVSECYFGYLDENENLIVRPIDGDLSAGPLIAENQIIDISQIGVGDLPGDDIKVKYNTRRLRPPENPSGELSEQEVANRNWEYEFSSVVNSDIKIQTFNNLEFTTYLFPNYTISETVNTYDSWNRKTSSITTTKKSIIVANPSYVNSAFQFNIINVWDSELTQNYVSSMKEGINTIEVDEREERYYTYSEPAVGEVNSCGYPEAEKDQDIGNIKTEEYRLYETPMAIAGAFNLKTYITGAFFSETNPIAVFTPPYKEEDGFSLTKKEIIEYESYDISLNNRSNGVTVPVNSETTKSTTTTWVSLIYTPEGQQLFYKLARSNIGIDLETNFLNLISQGAELVLLDKQVDIFYGANYGLQVRPTPEEINNSENSREQPNESFAEIAWATGSAASGTKNEFSMPYAPDDEITWSEEDGYGSIASDAGVKATNFGRIQNRLLLGNRYGVNIQLSPDILPNHPFDPLYINANGQMGQYRVNATNWVFDANGIVASIDALFWAAVGEDS